MALSKTLKKEIAQRISRFWPIRVTKGISTDMKLHGNLFYNRRPEALNEEELLFKGLDLNGKVVMDVGAHIGVYTFFFSKAVDDGKLLAFEPNPLNYDFLCRNIKRNCLGNVKAMNVGLADKEDSLQFVSDRYNTAKGTFKGDKQTLLKQKQSPVIERVVPVLTIDAVVRSEGIKRLDFVKIDTEGYEPFVIDGMPETLREFSPQVYFEVHGLTPEQKTADLRRIFHVLRRHDYRIFRVSGDYEEVIGAELVKHGGGGYFACPNDKCDIVHFLRFS